MMRATQCSGCGKDLAADSPQGLCPSCLLRRGLEQSGGPSTTSTTGGAPSFVPPTPEELGHLIPHLQVIELLGRGGMGVVYKARQTDLDRLVAVKIVAPSLAEQSASKERFLREARAAARLDHPNIVRIFRFEADREPAVLVMQYIDGRPLDRACEGHGPRYMAEILAKTAKALAYAHAQGIVHRDIKPENILVDFDGEPHIADFGLAGRLEELLAHDGHAAAGTPYYMAPEAFAGRSSAGPAADIYALGVTMYRLLTGRTPFAGNTLDDIRRNVIETEPPLPQEINPAIPEPLGRICLKAMERDPEHRYESAQLLADDLARFLEGKEVWARPTRYRAELRGKLQNHLTEIGLWREQNLIDLRQLDRLARPYRTLLEADYPWHELSRRFPWEAVLLRVGGWLVLLSSVMWPMFYWDRVGHWERIIAVGLPTLAINAVGWTFLRRRSRVNALIYLSIGALLLPLFVVVALDELGLATNRQTEGLELIRAQRSEDSLRPSNLQLTIASGVFLSYCITLLMATRARLLMFWVGTGVYLLFTGGLLLAGLRHWIEHEHVARALMFYLMLALSLWPAAMALNRQPATRPYAAIAYAFFVVPLIALMDLLARHGAVEWFHAYTGRNSEGINLWLMANGIVYFLAARWSFRSTSSFVRFWGLLLTLLVPIHLLVPTDMLFQTRPLPLTLGGEQITLYALLNGALALGLAILGTRLRQHAIALPALSGLAVFVILMTLRHFGDYVSWPLTLAVVGGLGMLSALGSLLWRTRRKHEPMI